MRIQTAGLACLVATVLPGLFGAVWIGLQDWQIWTQERAALARIHAVGSLQRAQAALDDATLAAAPGAAIQRAIAALLDDARADADAAGLNPQPIADATAAVHAAFANPDFAERLRAERQRLTGLVYAAASGLSDPAIAVAQQIMDVHDHATRRAAILDGWVRGQPMTPQGLAAANAETGGIAQAWDTAQQLIAGAAKLPQDALQTDLFWQQDEPRTRRLLEAWRDHAAAPDAGPDFHTWITPALDRLLRLRDAALRAATMAHVDAARAALIRCGVALGLGLAGASLALGAALTLRRQARAAMAQALQTLPDGAGQAREQDHREQDARHQAAHALLRQHMEAARQDSARVVNAIGTGLQRLAAGDVSFRLDQPLPAPYDSLRGDLNAALTQVQAMLRQIAGNSATLRASTRMVTHAADALARRTGRQAATLDQSASALNQVTQTLRMIGQTARAAGGAVSRIRAEAEDAALAVRTTARTLAAIEAASHKADTIMAGIQDLAHQISALALRAGIEAARAGEAGASFAAAAADMRNLAQRCSAAAWEGAALLAAVSGQMAHCGHLVAEAALTLDRTLAHGNEVAGAVAGIAAAAQGQAPALNGGTGGLGQMTRQTRMLGHAAAAGPAGTPDTGQANDRPSPLTNGADPTIP